MKEITLMTMMMMIIIIIIIIIIMAVIITTIVNPWGKVLEKLWNAEAVKKFPQVLSPKPSNDLFTTFHNILLLTAKSGQPSAQLFRCPYTVNHAQH
jgi:hypothetical protein